MKVRSADKLWLCWGIFPLLRCVEVDAHFVRVCRHAFVSAQELRSYAAGSKEEGVLNQICLSNALNSCNINSQPRREFSKRRPTYKKSNMFSQLSVQRKRSNATATMRKFYSYPLITFELSQVNSLLIHENVSVLASRNHHIY